MLISLDLISVFYFTQLTACSWYVKACMEPVHEIGDENEKMYYAIL